MYHYNLAIKKFKSKIRISFLHKSIGYEMHLFSTSTLDRAPIAKYIRCIRFSLSINIPSNLMSFIYILFLLCFVHTSLSTSSNIDFHDNRA